MLSIGDTVMYTGQKFHSDLATRKGMVVAFVDKSPGLVVVGYDDDSYVLMRNSLRLSKPKSTNMNEFSTKK